MNHLTDLRSLRDAVASGRRVSFFFFWGRRAAPAAEIGKWCLSQWWPAPSGVDGRTFATAEHFMMAEKARLFGDHEAETRIIASHDPAKAKSIGRSVKGFDERVWASHRLSIVIQGNRAKFEQHPRLAKFLASISEDAIAEASPTDAVWGIGLRETDAAARDPRRWRGTNLLGFALMEVRASLRQCGAPAC